MALLDEHIAKHGTTGLNQKYVSYATSKERTDVDAFQSAVQSYANDYGKYASDWSAADDPAYAQLREKQGNLLRYAQDYQARYSSDAGAKQYFDDVIKMLSSSNPKNARDYYSQWKTKEDYDTAVRNSQRRNQYSQMDEASVQKALAGMDRNSDDYKWLKNYTESGQYSVDKVDKYEKLRSNPDFATLKAKEYYDTAVRNSQRRNQYSQMDEASVQKALAGMDRNSDDYKWLNEYVNSGFYALDQYDKLRMNPDFRQYATAGSMIENPDYYDAAIPGAFRLFGGGKAIGNIVTFSRKNIDTILENRLEEGPQPGNFIYGEMTDDEVSIYNYLLAKENAGLSEKGSAQKYLDTLEETLNQRIGHRSAQNLLNMDDGVWKAFNIGIESLSAGVDSFAQGTRQLVNGDILPTSINQYRSAEIAENLTGFARQVYEAGVSTGNMLPSIMLSYFTGGIASGLGAGAKATQMISGITAGVTVGAGAGGNAYTEALRDGYTKQQAAAYGVLVGASEAALQTLIGGISAIRTGVSIDDRLLAKASLIDNALLRAVAKFGIDVGGEIVEEELQNYLEPAFRTILFGEDYDAPTIQEIIDTAVSTAISTGVLNGANSVINTASANSYYKSMYDADAQRALVAESLGMNPDNNRLAQKAQERLNAGKDLSGNTIRRISESNERSITTNGRNTIRQAALEQLSARGETENIAAIANAITKSAVGEDLTRAERRMIESSQYGQQVMNEVSPAAIQRGDEGTEWAQRIGTNSINFEEYNRLLQEAEIQPGEAQNVTDASKNVIDVSTEASETAPMTTNVTSNETAPTAVQPNATDVSTEASETAPMTTNVTSNETAPTAVQPNEMKAETATTKTQKAPADTLEKAAKQFGKHSAAFIATFNEGQNIAEYTPAYRNAYNYGHASVTFDSIKDSVSIAYLTETQRRIAYQEGATAASEEAAEKEADRKGRANGKTGRREGTVKGEGVNIADLDKAFGKGGAEYDTQKGRAYRAISFIAKETGINIVFYNSNFEGAQGRFDHSNPDTIYIDLNAGLLKASDINDPMKYAMLRTFSHEFTHFIEYWNPVQYNELRSVVFAELTKRGENVDALIAERMAATRLSYEKASREVVAEAMTDILPDSKFAENLAKNHKSIFNKLIEKIKEFAADLREYFANIGGNRSREANALKEQAGDALKYLDSIIAAFDKAAEGAVENFQMAFAVDEAKQTATAEKAEKPASKPQKAPKAEPQESKEPTVREVDVMGLMNNITKAQAEANETGETQEVKISDNYVQEEKPETQETTTETTVEAKAEPVTTTSEYGYTVTDNTERGTIQGKYSVGSYIITSDGIISKITSVYDGGEGSVWYKAIDDNGHKYSIPEKAARDFNAQMNLINGFINTIKNKAQRTKAKAFLTDVYNYNRIKSFADNENTHSEVKTKVKKIGDSAKTFNEYWILGTNSSIANSVSVVSKIEYDFYNYIRDLGKEQTAHSTEAEAQQETPAATERNETEEITNAEESENADNEVRVLQSEPDGEGTTRLLDELQADDVQRTGGRREPAGDNSQSGEGNGRHRVQQSASAGDRGSEGTGAVNDLRRSAGGRGGRPGRGDGARQAEQRDVGSLHADNERPEQSAEKTGRVTPEEKQAHDEALKETVTRQVAQESKEQPKGSNFVIQDSLNLPSGEKARVNANIDAIRLIKQLETEGRYATAEEQEALSKYVGWGGLSNAFGEMKWNSQTRRSEMVAKKGWEKEFDALRSLVDDGTITEQEYKDMSASTKNAHYTSIEVIKAMYDGLAQLGFTGGRMLEPSSGVGNFVGGMPSSMSRHVNSWTMVELDRITGQIAKYLYPNNDVRIQGFETANIPNGYMDVAIGNVPFGNYGVVDRTYPKRITKAIHNYFFAKSLDKVRTGGIVMFITSRYTMDSKDSELRRYIMNKADLLGAIRLPNNAFSGNAGTKVVTDILVLKKRAVGTEYTGEAFENAPYKTINGSYASGFVNEYFENHPEMVLGTAAIERGMYSADSLTYNPLEGKGTLGEQIREAYRHIHGKMDYKARTSPEKTNFEVERANKKTKNGGLEVGKDGKLYRNENSALMEVTTNKDTVARATGLLSIRDAYRTLANYLMQGVNDSYIKQARNALNKAYDDFVAKYGYINTPKNRAAIEEDPDRFSILSLENYDAEKKTAKKADIFTKNTIGPNRTITHVDNIQDGVTASINMTGGIDVPLIARLSGRTEEAITRELIDNRMAFKTKDGSLESPEKYLSGNVRAKLRDAEALAPLDKDFKNNVEELRKVVPKDIPHEEIYVSVGTPWIPNEVYADFIAETLGGHNWEGSYRGPDVVVGRTNQGEFKIVLNNSRLKTNFRNTQQWGTNRRPFLDLVKAMITGGSLTVYDSYKEEGKTVRILNKVETDAANAKAEEITKEFQDWLWRDESRAKELEKLYNETFNALVTPKYNGDNLIVNGLNAEFKLRPHQAGAVQRIITSGGNTLLAHRVGAGKTLEMASAAMKLRELGVVKKPMFVVPKPLVAQWGQEFKSYYPAAKLLVADDKSFAKAKRKVFTNQIANGDFDAIIVSYEQFEKVPMSKDYQREFYQAQIDEILDAIAEEKAETKGKGITVKEMEKKKAQLEKKIAELNKKEKDEDNIDFEQLGIDSLFVDEAHNFKNLQYITKMNNVSGLGNTDGSQRAFDLFTKIRYLQGLNGGRGIVFATATPVMNSMAEMYIMQMYLQSDMLNQLGLKTFDAWAKQFGEIVNSIEVNPSGVGFRQKQTFSNFRNLNELQLLFRSFSDVLTQVPGLEIPSMKGGAVKVVQCEPGEFQKNYMLEIQKRAENVKNVDPSVDNMLKITSDGKKVSYTQRMIDPSLPYEEGCKIYKCCDNVLSEYKESTGIKGTQIIFCDMATPKGRSKASANLDENIDDTELDTSSARLYDDMKAYLVKKGIPAKEIAFIHDADTDAKKKKLFEDVNEGSVRVLIGSTGKMGVGMNAQKRIVAIHHLDAPWRPGDVEQRDGRAFRQKNMNKEVSKYVYVTTGSFDARLWDILDRKQHFIDQIMNGEDVGRIAEDTGEVTLSAAEVKALALNDPEMKEFIELGTEIQRLQNLKKSYSTGIAAAKSKLQQDERMMRSTENAIERVKQDIKSTRVDTYSEGKFSMTVGNRSFTDKKDAGAALAEIILTKAKRDDFVTVGKFAGFEIRVLDKGGEYEGQLHGVGNYKFNVYSNNTTYMVNHIIGVVEGLETRQKALETELSETTDDRDAQEKIIAAPFAKQAEYDQKLSRYNVLMDKFNPKNEQTIGDETGEDTETLYQLRPENDDDEVQYSLRTLPDGTKVAWEDRNILLDKPEGMKISNYIHDYIFDHINDTAIVESTNDIVYMDKQLPSEYISSKYTMDLLRGNIKKLVVKNRMAGYLKDMLLAAYERSGPEKAVHSHNKDAMHGVYSFKTRFAFPVYNVNGSIKSVNVYTAKLIVNYASDKNLYLYDIEDIQKDDQSALSVLGKIRSETANQPKIVTSMIPQTEGEVNDDFSQYQQRTSPITNRELLSIAASEVNVEGMTEAERGALDVFKRRLTALYDLEQKRLEEGQKYKEQQFGANVDREEAKKTLNRMKILDDQIKRANDAVLDVENREVLKKVLVKARKVIERTERARGQEILRRYRDRQANFSAIKKYRERVMTDTATLRKWITHPDNKNALAHVNDSLKNSVITFLNSIDFTSKRQLRGGDATKADKAFVDGLNKLKNALKENADLQGMYSGYSDLPEDFFEEMQKFVEAVRVLADGSMGTFVINRMTAEELKTLSRLVRATMKMIMNMNRFHQNAMFRHVYEAGDNSVESMREIKTPDKTNGMTNFLFWQQIRPAYGFERFGEGGKAIYDEFRRAQAKLAFNTQIIKDFAENAFTEKEVQAWTKEIKTFDLGGDTVRIPVSYLMGLYELSKRPQAMTHLLGAGLRVATFTNKKEKIADTGHELTQADIKAMTDALTERQKEVADTLQQFMANQGGKWGNYVSVARFGEEQFGEEHYYPINSDGRHLQATADEAPSAASLYALLNMSFTKELKENASNRIILYDIFDVFANHMASMAQYNAFALPILDSLKWLNYRQVEVDEDGHKTTLGSVREEMARAYGTDTEDRPGSGRRGYAENFVTNIIKAYNGTETQGIATDVQGVNALHRYNMAQVAYNFRVAVQQPMAITRAGMLVDYRNILRGLMQSPAQIRANIEEMNKYSGIAAWKDLGFYDINISRGLTDIIKHNKTFLDKVGDVGMAGAEFADKITWAAMWNACKVQVSRTRVNDGSPEFFSAVTKLFEDVIYKTQVVDSVLTKNEFMRSKGLWGRMLGSFMSEPVTTASMLLDAFQKYRADIQRGDTRQQAWQKNARNIGRTAYVYALSAALLAVVQSAIDALRDDDDYQNYFQKWKEAFLGNLIDEANPLNKLPIMNDVVEAIKSLLETWGVDTYGNEPSSVIFQWRDSLVKGSDIIHSLVTGDEKNHYTWYGGIYKLLQAASGATGFPIAAMAREINVGWNSIIGQFAPSLKLKTYDPGKKKGIQYAYKDGYMSDEESIKQLVESKEAKDRDEAYWMVENWKTGESSNYAKVYEAMRTGKGFDAAVKEMTAHGYKEKKVISQVKTTIGEWYRGTEDKAPSISENEAIRMLVKYGGLSDADAREKVQGWKSSLDTGYSLSEVSEALVEGEITQDEAERIWRTYGGYSREDAHGKAQAALLEDKYPGWEGIKSASAKYQKYGVGLWTESAYLDAVYQMEQYKGTDNDGDGETDTGSVQAQRWAYIDSLRISNAQKDALHLAYYKDTTLKKAPWNK